MSDIVHAYRHTYRALLQAVQYSSPARYVVRDQVRLAFRDSSTNTTWDRESAKRTLWFLQAAAKSRGLEHRILKNLVRVRLQRTRNQTLWKKILAESRSKNDVPADKETAFYHYDMTIAMLNQSMGLCLR